MIKLKKSPEPEVLRVNKKAWTDEYAKYRANVEVPEAAATRYRHRDIKSLLIEDCHGKCIYCESKLLHVTPGHVEHMMPKSRFPEHVCDWSNLALVCDECNRIKGNKWYEDESSRFLNPFEDEPQAHLIFAGPLVMHKAGAGRGEITWRELNLNRHPLLMRRIERLQALNTLRDLWAGEQDPNRKQLIRQQLLCEIEADHEYAAMCRDYLRQIEVI